MGNGSRVVVGFSVLLGLVSGCAREEVSSAPTNPPPVSDRLNLATGPTSGTLSGQPFKVRTARYSVDRRPGYERLEIRLLDVPEKTPCEDHESEKPSSVWIRRQGGGPAKPGKYLIKGGIDSGWEVHYETHHNGSWLGNGRANAVLMLEDVRVDGRIEGVLHACFGDREKSCVKGHFEATYCPITIDAPVRGAHAMEAGPSAEASTNQTTAYKLGSDASPIAIEPRQQLLPTYPCSRCHDALEPRPKKYVLKKFHTVRNDEFSHGEDEFWCYQCHSIENIDHLRTATGKQVSFNEAYRICTSCHGDKLEDWRVGVHGLVLGNYNGKKFKKSCPACHDPHNPRFPLMKPMPPPAPPREWRTL